MARPASKFAVLQANQKEKLNEIWKSHHAHRARMRAHAVLLSSQGYTVEALAEIFSVTRDTAAGWIDRFMNGGVESLEDSDRPGAPPLLDEQEQQLLRELFKRYPNRPSNPRRCLLNCSDEPENRCTNRHCGNTPADSD